VSRSPFEVILVGSGWGYLPGRAEVTVGPRQAYKVMRPVLNLQNSHKQQGLHSFRGFLRLSKKWHIVPFVILE
jgi:hypothetical protein